MAQKLSVETQELLWKDRRRRLGLPLSFTRYELYEDKLVLRTGFFKTTVDEIMIFRIMDIKLVRTLGQKLFGVGTVVLMSSDKSHPQLEIKSVKQSDTVRRFISELVDKQRTARGISSRELLGDVFDGDAFDGDGI